MTFTVEVTSEATRLQDVREAWQQLWHRAGTTIFQTHDWISGWTVGIRDRKDIRILIALAWDGPTLAGVMACAVHRRSGLRVLQWAGQLFSDYCDTLIDPDCSQRAVHQQLWERLWQVGGFDVVSLQQVRPDARCRSFLEELARSGGPLQVGSRQDRCMRIENRWPDGEAFFRSLNKKARNNHTRGKRILSELGGAIQLQVMEPGQPVGRTIDAILHLKEAWLRVADPTSSLLGSDRGVLRAVLVGAWASGFARIFLLTCQGQIAAASINFLYAGRMEAYMTSYDAMYERASPGAILIVEYARWSFDRGVSHVDLLRGDEPFKGRLANAEIRTESFDGSRTLVGHVAVSGHRWLCRHRRSHTSHFSDVLEAAE